MKWVSLMETNPLWKTISNHDSHTNPWPLEDGEVWNANLQSCCFFKYLPSLKLTWHLKMDGWNTRFLLGWPIFRCYVSCRECISLRKSVVFWHSSNPPPPPLMVTTALKLETIETETRWSSCWSPRPSRHAKLKEFLVSKVSGEYISSPWYSIELCLKHFQEKRGQSVCWILLIAMSIPN